MLYLTCTTMTSVDLAHYGVSRAKDWVFVDCGTIINKALRTGLPIRKVALKSGCRPKMMGNDYFSNDCLSVSVDSYFYCMVTDWLGDNK